MRMKKEHRELIDAKCQELRERYHDSTTNQVDEGEHSPFIADLAAWGDQQPWSRDPVRLAIQWRRDNVERWQLPRDGDGNLMYGDGYVIVLSLEEARTIKSERVRRADLAENIEMERESFRQRMDAYVRDDHWKVAQLSLFETEEEFWPDVQKRQGK
jgi:hypothetical protein